MISRYKKYQFAHLQFSFSSIPYPTLRNNLTRAYSVKLVLHMDAFHMLFSFLCVCFFWSLTIFRSETIMTNSGVLRQLGIHQHSLSLRPTAPSLSNCTLPSIIPPLIAVGDSVDCEDCFPPSATSNSRIDVSYSPSLKSNVTTGSLISTLRCSF